MRDLRLIGVHDDGEHLVVTDDTGVEFRLRIDEQLRAAARRDRPRLGQLQIAIDNDVRPREIQAMIRAGATADEVAARTGWDLEKVARFEGPVIAEREHVAGRAQTVRMRGTNQAGAPETLAQRVATRLNGRGVDPASVDWDASRDAEGQWTLSAAFTAGGRERAATWWFDQAGMSVVARNDEAKWLSEVDAPAGPVPAAVHRPTAVFDVEVEDNRAERAHKANTDDLIASMREHSGARGRRGGRRRTRGAEPSPPATEDELPLETEDERPPAARGTHPKDIADQDAKGAVTSDPSTQPIAVEPAGAPEPEAEETETTKPEVEPAKPEVKKRGKSQRMKTQPTKEKAPADEPKATEPTKNAPEKSVPAQSATDHGEPTKDEASKDEPVTPGPQAASTSAAQTDMQTDAKADAEADAKAEQATDSPSDTHSDKTEATSADLDETTEATDVDEETSPAEKPGKGRGRKGRASVPSWDDVMFGTRRD